jgi:chemotaxis protein histidine kinase CheA
VSAGLPANSDEPGNAEDRQHEMEEAQREAEEAQKRGQEEAKESQSAVNALKPPENDALDAAVASASSAAESQQRKLEDAQMEAEEKQREAQQEYEKEQSKRNAAADAEREATNEALEDAAADAAAEVSSHVKDAYHDAEAAVSAAGGGAEEAAAAGATAAAKAEAEALEDPYGEAQAPSGHHQWINGWTRDELRHLFLHGTPSNDLSEAGLTVHCFDGTEDHAQPWRPCDAGACKQFAKWWSASIISVKQPATFSNAGIILTPSKTKLLCSFPSDFGSMNAGCKWSDKPHVWQPFDADHTKEMLTNSMDMNSTGNLGAKTLGITMYNEVLVDSGDMMSHMPKSIGAFVFFEDNEFNHQRPYTPLPEKIVATNAYVALLDYYNLTETDIPILQVNRTDGSFIDVSRGARRFLELHSFEQYRKRHPYWQDAWRQQTAQDGVPNPSTMRKKLFEKISGANAHPEYQARPPWNPYAWLENFSRAHGGAPGDWAL